MKIENEQLKDELQKLVHMENISALADMLKSCAVTGQEHLLAELLRISGILIDRGHTTNRRLNTLEKIHDRQHEIISKQVNELAKESNTRLDAQYRLICNAQVVTVFWKVGIFFAFCTSMVALWRSFR